MRYSHITFNQDNTGILTSTDFTAMVSSNLLPFSPGRELYMELLDSSLSELAYQIPTPTTNRFKAN